MNVVAHNREAWDLQVQKGNPWTIPVSADAISRARAGDWQIILTPNIPVPRSWYPPIAGCRALCLASGGGQQGPILAAAGAVVTVFDNSPAQLDRDRQLSGQHNLGITPVFGDMADLSRFADGSFDLIVHPVSNVFAPDVRPVWREVARVLRQGGILMAGFNNPVLHLFDCEAAERGELIACHKLPYSDLEGLPREKRDDLIHRKVPLEFSHTLQDQIGGQCDAGLAITALFEDRDTPPYQNILNEYMPIYIATSPESLAALGIWQQFRLGLPGNLLACASGRQLVEMGYRVDVEMSAELDIDTIMPVLCDGRYTVAPV